VYVAVVVLAVVALGCIPAAEALAVARWPHRSPAAAILLWQALGLGWGLAAVGALIGVGAAGGVPGLPASQQAKGSGVISGAVTAVVGVLRGHPTELTFLAMLRLACLVAGCALLGVLCWILLAASAAVLRARQRQRVLLRLLAHGDPKVPGALVVDHPAAAAYCLPGLRAAIVISAGTLDLLDDHELAAVLAHERAHVRERHDLVLLPFIALLRAFRWSRTAREAHSAVALLVEMHADDRARRHRPARELATALLRVGAAGGGLAPIGALAVVPHRGTRAGQPGSSPQGCAEVAARVTRLLRPAPGLGACELALVGLAAVTAVLVPVALLALPL
jgi:Zn-dependent protease with chaperone function